MDFVETAEQQLLRKSVAQLAGRYGHAYWLEKARAGEKTDELWSEVGRLGYLGVNVPEEYGGGGRGILELSIVCEELAAAGCPLLLLVVSPAICASVIARSRHRGAAPALAARHRLRRAEDGLRDHRAGRRLQLPPDHQHAQRGRRRGRPDRPQDVHLRGGRGAGGAGRRAVPGRPDRDAAAGAGGGADRRARLRAALIPVEITGPEKQFALFFDQVRLPADAVVGETAEAALAALFAGLNPERITGAAFAVGIGRYALAKGTAYAKERAVWGVPIGAHQGLSHPLANAAIQVELARLMTQKAGWLYDAGLDAEAGEAANMAKYAAAEASLLALDQAIQVHGGNGFATEYGLATLWGAVRLARTAPISREMILNFVASHTLGLPRSY